MKRLLVLFIVMAFLPILFGCPMNAQIKYPDTPRGQAAYFLGGYHDQADIYINERPWATADQHIKILTGRLEVMKSIDSTFDRIGEAGAANLPIADALIASAKDGLSQFKRYLYSKQAVPPTEAQVKAQLVKLGWVSDSEYQSQNAVQLLLIITELVQAFSPMWDRLVSMGTMTPEQVDAEFAYQWQWKQGFDPYALPLPSK